MRSDIPKLTHQSMHQAANHATLGRMDLFSREEANEMLRGRKALKNESFFKNQSSHTMG